MSRAACRRPRAPGHLPTLTVTASAEVCALHVDRPGEGDPVLDKVAHRSARVVPKLMRHTLPDAALGHAELVALGVGHRDPALRALLAVPELRRTEGHQPGDL